MAGLYYRLILECTICELFSFTPIQNKTKIIFLLKKKYELRKLTSKIKCFLNESIYSELAQVKSWETADLKLKSLTMVLAKFLPASYRENLIHRPGILET